MAILKKFGFINRSSYKSFKESEKILETRKCWSSKAVRDHFASGVYMGLGSFDMIISFFPSKFIKLLEFAGFSGDRHVRLTSCLTFALTTKLTHVTLLYTRAHVSVIMTHEKCISLITVEGLFLKHTITSTITFAHETRSPITRS